MKKLVLLGFLLALVMPLYAHANVTVNQVAGTTYQTSGLTGFATTGAKMDGMSVTVNFVGGTSATASWADTAASSGAASGTGWSLSQSGDTFGGAWTLTNSTGLAIDSVLINGQPGKTIFDRTFGDLEGTAGSALGMDFATAYDVVDIVATYMDILALTGSDPVGDLFVKLLIDFQGAGFASGAAVPNIMTFVADTDNADAAGDITPTPEPMTLLLLGLGLIGVTGLRRKS